MMIRGALLLLLAGCGPAPDVAVGSGGAESSTTEEVQESSSSSSSTTSTSSAVTTWEPPDRCERWPSEGCGQVLGENAAVSGKTPFGNADLRYAFFIPKCGCCNSCIDLVYAAIYFVADPEGPWNTQSRRAIRVEVNQDRYTAALLGTAYVYSTYDRPDIGVQGPLVVDHFPSIGELGAPFDPANPAILSGTIELKNENWNLQGTFEAVFCPEFTQTHPCE